jgi:hypothetical protein
MNRLKSIPSAAVLILVLATAGMAEEPEANIEGTASVGGHYYFQDGTFSRVGEYVSWQDVEDLIMDFDVNARVDTDNMLSRILMLYRDQNTNAYAFDMNTNSYVDADFDYRAFVHNFDKDYLQNLQAKAGGKQVYRSDNDPLGRYWINFRRFESNLEADLPFIPQGQVYGRYEDQRKVGRKQVMTINHCAYCHVNSNGREVNSQIKTWRSGIDGSAGAVSFNYEFVATNYTDHTQTPNHHYDRAMHPVFGDVGSPTNPNFPGHQEFGSRLAFEDSTMAYSQQATTEKFNHHVGLKVELPKQNLLRGAYTHTQKENKNTQVKHKFDAYVASWVGKFSKRTWFSARYMAYKTKVDDYFVDLADYRQALDPNTGRGTPIGGGGQNFDWWRYSAANRDVWQTDLIAAYKFTKAGYLKLKWRHKDIDRPAMNQSQTTFYNDNGNITGTPSTPYANRTKIDKLKLTYSKRFNRKGNLLAYVDVGWYDLPFMNVTAMCEPGLSGTDVSLPGNNWVYYFQRMRTGNGSSLPSQSHKGSVRASYQLSARSSLSGFLTGGTEKNDQMNTYQFDRDFLNTGLNFWTAPSDRFLVTVGYQYNKYKSNANLCPPIFDG